MKMNCPVHDVPMMKRRSQYRNTYWCYCPHRPDCDMSYSETLDGRPIDYPAGKEIKALRRKCHELMDEAFGSFKVKKFRMIMYAWLKKKVATGHIGTASKEELETVIKELSEMLED